MTLTGNQFEIAAGPYSAVITEGGAGLRRLTHDGHDLILPHDADKVAPAAFGQLLIPWPNRVDGGRYSYGGATHQLDISEPPLDCAIHGLARCATWTQAEHRPDRVRLTHRLLGHGGYPYRLDLEVEYALDADSGLTIRLSARNTGSQTAPYGHGAHPYLTVGEPIDSCTVSIPGGSYLPTNDRKLPIGPPVEVTGTRYDLREPKVLGDLVIDNAYTDLLPGEDGRLRVRLTNSAGDRSVTFWMDDAHPWLEIYTADEVPQVQRRLGLGVEPMTCPPNAFVSGIDMIDLKPGATTTGSWGIMAG
jgi:aldose 1-epimerase